MSARDSIYDSAEKLMKHFGEQAREALIEKLKDGKKVGRCDLLDVLDCELNGERYRITLQEIFGLLMGETGKTRDYQADQIIQGICERYVDSHPDLVEEEAEAIANPLEDA